MKWTRYIFLPLMALLISCGGEINSAGFGEPAPVLTNEPSEKLRVLVIGGTSGIGLETVKLALERGHHVIAIARRPERMELSHKNLDTVKGDILDASSVANLMSGVDVVVIAIGISPTRKPVSVFSKGTINVLNAMKKHGVERLITITGIGAGDSRGHGGFFYDNVMQPFLLDTLYDDKDRAEKLILESSSNWTIVRPGFLNDETASKHYRVIKNMHGVTAGGIARADVAHFVVSEFEMDNHMRETILLSN